MSKPREIVIIGGGIIGCTTAYYLSRHPNFPSSNSTITLIEASTKGPAQGASGKAGGLVAKWAYPKELVEVSFEEHVKLATEHNGTDRWGWRYVSMGSWEGRGEVYSDSTGGSAVGKGGKRKSLEKTLGLEEGGRSRKTDRKDKGLPEDLWVKEELTDSYSSMAPEGATAQVHPYLFTTSMLQLAKENGVIFKAGKVTTITSDSGRVIGIEYLDPTTKETREVSATDVVLCAGAWSPRILSSLPISATRAHSITIRVPPSSKIAPYVLFTEITQPSGFSHGGRIVTPEIYARPGNEVYACGPGDDSKLPDTVDQVVVDLEACENLRHQVSSISQELRDGTVEARQACFLPSVTSGGGPIVGESNLSRGLFVATGHTCWGICNAPGTAKAISELIMNGQVLCANLKRMNPSEFL